MSRRDTIIVAVLVNAGLLMVLFATATKSKAEKTSSPIPIVQEIPAAVEKKPVKQVAAATTLDKLLFASEEALAAEQLFEEEEVPLVQVGEEPEHTITITVKQGDALDKIARANHTTIAQIMQLNALSSTQLQLGQRLKIPVTHAPMAAATTTQPAPLSNNPEDFYIVKDGDNPWLIATKSHVKLEELLRLNNLDEKKAKKLRPGDRLRIR